MQRLHHLSDIAQRLPAQPTLVLHSACAEPRWLAAQLASEAISFSGAQLHCMMPMGEAPYAQASASDHLKVVSFFPGKGLRDAITQGRAVTLRHSLSEIPGLFDRRERHADALLLQVTPPDQHGRVSLGLAVDYMPAVLRQKPLVIAQINPRMPRTCGDTLIDASAIDYCFEVDEDPQWVPAVPGEETDERIARSIAQLIDDGAVLQVGIGSLPDQVLRCLTHHRNLGLHSGVITDAVQPLIESGVINNRTKQRYQGVSVTTMAAGTRALYDFLHNNPQIEFHPCSLTHNVQLLAEIEGLTAVNGALQIDLSGRINAERVGGRTVSAPGGLPDFARGASRAVHGKSIIALKASVRDRSNIVASLPSTMPVTLSGEHVDYVVTEFGIAKLRGLSGTARAEALIAVADPKHQGALQTALAMGTHA